DVIGRSNVRATDNAPGTAVPILNQRLGNVGTAIIEADSPDIVRSCATNPKESVVERSDVWAGNRTPLRPIPMLGQCRSDTADRTNRGSYRPGIVGGEGCHRGQITIP